MSAVRNPDWISRRTYLSTPLCWKPSLEARHLHHLSLTLPCSLGVMCRRRRRRRLDGNPRRCHQLCAVLPVLLRADHARLHREGRSPRYAAISRTTLGLHPRLRYSRRCLPRTPIARLCAPCRPRRRRVRSPSQTTAKMTVSFHKTSVPRTWI